MNRYDVPTTATRARQVWEAVLGEVQLQVTRPCYETWFKNTSGVAYKEGELTVSAPSTFVAEMLESRMYNIICQAAERVAHEAVDIKFRVRGGADPNYAGSEAPVHVNGSTNHAANGAPSDTPPPSATNGHVAASPAAGANRAQGPGGSDGQRRLTSTYTFS
ncbi:MAG: hypothetical protein FJ317_09030, partial [SAR202 cluster bacterium]|nr:hypothetical protein [SAR202 cluster bacterium]